jgi:hypothetical protein
MIRTTSSRTWRKEIWYCYMKTNLEAYKQTKDALYSSIPIYANHDRNHSEIGLAGWTNGEGMGERFILETLLCP